MAPANRCRGDLVGERRHGLYLLRPGCDTATQEHIILHELAHILSGHAQEPIDAQALHELYFSHLDHDTVHLALSRSCYDSKTEREAEVLASLIEQRWRIPHLAAGSPSVIGDDSNGPTDTDIQRVREHLDEFAAKLQDD